MSIALMNEVWDADLDAKSKLILLSLADNANDAGICWPTQATIARRASLSERSVRDYLHRLADEGFITVLELGNGRGLSTKYRLNLDAIKAAKAAEIDQKAAETVVKAEDTCRPTTISQPPSSTDLSLARGVSEQAYVSATGRSVRNTMLRQVLDGIDAAHPAECVKSVWEGSAGANEPWAFAKAKFDRCQMEGHWPRQARGSNGRGTSRGSVRQGDGASERRPEGQAGFRREYTDAEAAARREQLEREGAALKAAGSAAGEVG